MNDSAIRKETDSLGEVSVPGVMLRGARVVDPEKMVEPHIAAA